MNYNTVDDSKWQLYFCCKQIGLKFMLRYKKIKYSGLFVLHTVNLYIKGQAVLLGNSPPALNLPEYDKTCVTSDTSL